MRTKMLLAVGATLVAVSTSAPAGAQAGQPGGARLAAVQAAAATAISARLAALKVAQAEIASLTDLGSDQQTLTTRLDQTTSALNALQATIASDATPSAAAADARRIVTDERVYALVLPAAYLTAAADRIANEAIPRFTSLATKLGAAIAASKATGLQPTLADLQSKVSAAAALSSGLPDALAALTPAAYDSDHSVVATHRASLVTARADLRAASADAHQIVNALPAH